MNRRLLLKHSAIIGAAALGLTALPGNSRALLSAEEQNTVPCSSWRPTYRTADINGLKVFYREAGNASLPTLVLLHGNPSSSFMFRDLIPLLAHHFHIIAPDYPGFGYSDRPDPEAFSYTFDHLAETMNVFLSKIGISDYILYMQDYGGPVGMRLVTAHPERVRGLIIQNANSYVEGISTQWRAELEQQIKDAAMPRSITKPREHKPPSSFHANLKWTKGMYIAGARDPSMMTPDGYTFDAAMLSRAGQDDIQDALGDDYYKNVLLYPAWQKWLRLHQPRTLLVWGKGDQIFGPAAANAYLRDLPKAKLVFYNGGHFVLEEYAPEVAQEIIKMFAAGTQPKSACAHRSSF